jgi:hypothetical protein
MKIDERVRVVRGIHTGKLGMIKSINNTVVGCYPNQRYVKNFNIMSNNGNLFSVHANDVKPIEG